MMKTLAKKALARIGLDDCAARAYWRAYGTLRFNSRVARRYLADADEPKLHLGCGNHPLDGWLNTDASPRAADVMRLDAARPFPFPDAAFARVYTEHMIGHLPFRSAELALAESFRVLSPGGKIRVSTPDLAFLIDLWRGEISPLQERYLAWASADLPRNGSCFVINRFMRAWGHEFIYDEATLRESLETAGFTNVTRRALNESGDAALRNLENEKRMPDGFLRLESLILEGSKPPNAAP